MTIFQYCTWEEKGGMSWSIPSPATLLLHMMFQSSYNHTIIQSHCIVAGNILILCWSASPLFGDNCFHLLWPGGTVQATISTKYINMKSWFICFPVEIFISHGIVSSDTAKILNICRDLGLSIYASCLTDWVLIITWVCNPASYVYPILL